MQGFVDHINKREDQNPDPKITGTEYSRDHCHYNNQDHQTVCEIHIVLSKPFIPDKWFVFIMIDIQFWKWFVPIDQNAVLQKCILPESSLRFITYGPLDISIVSFSYISYCSSSLILKSLLYILVSSYIQIFTWELV